MTRAAIVLAACTVCVPLAAQQPAPDALAGTIRIWGHGALGHDYIESLVRKWETGFQQRHPQVQFDNQLHGTASAVGALYTHTGDVAIMGREIWPVEVEAFEEVLHHPPTSIDVVTGSLDIRNKDFALVVFVNKANPLAQLSLPQMRALFSATPGKPNPRTWGDLGLTGEWAARPIHLYSFEIHRGFGYYLQQVVFGGSALWNPTLTELGDIPKPGGKLLDAGQRIVDAIGADPDAIGYSSLLYKNADVRAVPLGPAGGPYVLATHTTIADHSYPLTRTITAVLDTQPADAKTAEFVRYILSPAGQQAVTEDGGYTALTPTLAQAGLKQLP